MKLVISTQNKCFYIAEYLLSIAIGIYYVLPLMIPFYQYATCQFIVLIIAQVDCFLFRRWQIEQIYLYGFGLSCCLLYCNSFINSCLIGLFLGAILSVKQQFCKQRDHEYRSFIYVIGQLFYFVILQYGPYQIMSLLAFNLFTFSRVFSSGVQFEQNMEPKPLVYSSNQQYQVILGQVALYLIFYWSLFSLYQLNEIIVQITLVCYIIIHVISYEFEHQIAFIQKIVLLIEIILLLTWTIEDIYQFIPFQYEIRIIVLFLSKPLNQLFIKNKFNLEQYGVEFKYKTILEFVCSVIVGSFVF